MYLRSDSRRLATYVHGTKQRRRPSGRILTAESLESRRLLSTNTTWNASLGKLSVVGTEQSDELFIRARSGYVSVENESGSVVHWNGSAAGVTTGMVQLIDVAGTNYMGGADGNDKIHLGDVTAAHGFTGILGTTLNGGGGDDVITGSGFADFIIGHKGADLIYAGAGDDTISALYGSSSDGGEGNDSIYGGDGNDSIDAGSGIDFVDGGDGHDWIHGGDGPEGDYLNGGEGDDTIYGGDGAEGDTIYGDGGNDLLIGGTGSDFYGYRGVAQGEDTIVEAADSDHDSIDFGEFGTAITLDLSSTSQQTVSAGTKITLSSSRGLENVRGTSGADLIIGNALDNVLFGGGGNDTLYGNDGHDLLHGQDGADVLYGGNGRDVLVGGMGADTLQGDAGEDLLWGGKGGFGQPEEVAWSDILKEWTSEASYNVRVARLSGEAGGANNGKYLNGSTLINDTAVDVLTGGADADWLLADLPLDTLTDLTTGELTETNTFPTTNGIDNIVVDEDADSIVINLATIFNDAQQSGLSLSYSIVSNTNSQLFSSVEINPVTGELIISFASDEFGSATLTISATDNLGFTTNTTFEVQVEPVNDPPKIVAPPGNEQGWYVQPGNIYTFFGRVIDPEGNEGLTVEFGGLLAGHSTTTDENGAFSYTVHLPENSFESITAKVTDAGGLESNTWFYLIGEY